MSTTLGTSPLLSDLDRLQASISGFVSATLVDTVTGVITDFRVTESRANDATAHAVALAVGSRGLMDIDGLEEVVVTTAGELHVLYAIDDTHMLVLAVDRYRTNPSLIRATLRGWRSGRD